MNDDLRFGASADIRFDESVAELLSFLTDRRLRHLELRQGYLDVNGTPPAERLRSLAAEYDVTYTLHAPHIDCALGNVNETLREAAVAGVKRSLDLAAAIDAVGVVVHGGSARLRHPDRVNRYERAQAVASLRECAWHADEVGVPLCLENQRDKASERRNTATPRRLAEFLADVGVDSESLRVTLDVGHAKASGLDYGAFVDRFGDRIHVAHLHDNDGTADDHDPLPDFRRVAADVGAPYNVLEMKSLADVDRCVSGERASTDAE
jgi:sugar phosphate isomerase/epimerase